MLGTLLRLQLNELTNLKSTLSDCGNQVSSNICRQATPWRMRNVCDTFITQIADGFRFILQRRLVRKADLCFIPAVCRYTL